MSDYPANFENLENFLSVSPMNPDKLRLVKGKLNQGFSLAFLVTANFDIHIGTTAGHKDIIPSLPADSQVIEKGVISGRTKKISWVVSDSQKDREITTQNLAKLQAAIKTKINQFLDLGYYLV